jgi:hypothetical protein
MIVIVHQQMYRGLLISLGWYLCWWTITITGLRTLLVDYYYHYVDTSTGGLLLSLGWYLYWLTINITWLISLLVDYYYHWVETSTGGLLLALGWYLYWCTITSTGLIPLLVDYYYHWKYQPVIVIVHQQRYQPSHITSPPVEVSTQW